MSILFAIYPCKIYNNISCPPLVIYDPHKKLILCGYRMRCAGCKKRAVRKTVQPAVPGGTS